MTWSGTTAIYTAKGLYDDMKAIFGADAAGATKRALLVKHAVEVCGGWAWNLAPWAFRHIVLALTTVANQAYTTLPTDYARYPAFGDWLVGSSDDWDRPRYVNPSVFKQVTENLEDDGQRRAPEVFTLGYEEIDSVYTPVVRWAPTPSSGKSYGGFQYFRAFPGVDVTDDEIVLFPDVAFDDLWEMRTVRRLAHRIRLTEVNPPTAAELAEAIIDARMNLEYHPVMPVAVDVNRDAEDIVGLAVSGVAEQYDGDGNLLMLGD